MRVDSQRLVCAEQPFLPQVGISVGFYVDAFFDFR
jgi:hypothetical protein